MLIRRLGPPLKQGELRELRLGTAFGGRMGVYLVRVFYVPEPRCGMYREMEELAA